MPADERGRFLLAHARAALHEAVGGPAFGLEPAAGDLDEVGATFVTLLRDGELCGCIGTLEPRLPLVEDVRRNARAAALEDTRFRPVHAGELDRIAVEVSLLSPLEEIAVESEERFLTGLRPGEDGLVLEHEGRRATYLPQVWEGLPAPADFVRELKAKAGLPRDFWAPDLRAWRFTVTKYAE